MVLNGNVDCIVNIGPVWLSSSFLAILSVSLNEIGSFLEISESKFFGHNIRALGGPSLAYMGKSLGGSNASLLSKVSQKCFQHIFF